MKSIGDTITIKTLQELLDEHLIQKITDTSYISTDARIPWHLVGNESYLGRTFEITNIDEECENVPYLIKNRFWIPLFMIKVSNEPDQSSTETVEEEASISESKKSIFSKLIELEKSIFNTTTIKDSKVKRLSKCSERELNLIEDILSNCDSNYHTYASAISNGLIDSTQITRQLYIYKFCNIIL